MGPTSPAGALGGRPAPPGGVGAPQPPFISPSVSVYVTAIYGWGFCPVQFREYFLCRFSETKNSRKQKTGTGHLVNRLVRENANKYNKMYIKHVANDII